MTRRTDKAGRSQPCRAPNFRTRIARILLPVAAVAVATMADLPRLPLIGIDLGSTPAFAKNDRAGRGDRGDRGNRGQGQERRHARADDATLQYRSQPDHADNGRHRGHDRAARDETDRRATAPRGIIPPRRPLPDDEGFRNHGDRVSTFVALAKAQGLNPGIGAMQANFGTPFENDLVVFDPDSGTYVTTADAEEIAAVKPGNGPKSGWETESGLDVDLDGDVDRDDLELALANYRPADDGSSGDGQDGDGQAAVLRVGREDGDPAF